MLPPTRRDSNVTNSTEIQPNYKNSPLAGVDFIKYIMSYAVVAIHFRPNYGNEFEYPFIAEWFIRLAVPFYFITSGYLLQHKIKTIDNIIDGRKLIIARALKIIKLWAIWMLLSLPLSIYSYSVHHLGFIVALKSYIYNLIVYGVSKRAEPLWFLYSLFWLTLLIGLTLKRRNATHYMFGMFACLTLSNWYAAYTDNTIIQNIAHYTRYNLAGGIYVISGILFYNLKHFVNTRLIILTILSSLLLAFFKLPFYELLGGVSLFMIGCTLPFKNISAMLGLRSQSMWIYYTHEYILFIIFIVFAIQDKISNPYILLAAVFAMAGIGAYCLYTLQKRRMKFLNTLVQ